MPDLVRDTMEQYDKDQKLYVDALEDAPDHSAELAQALCSRPDRLPPRLFQGQGCEDDGEFLAAAEEEYQLRLIANAAALDEGLKLPGVVSAPITDDQLVQALDLAQQSQYFTQVYKITNEGRTAADPVRVVPPGGFEQTNEEPLIAPLSPDNQRVFIFRTEEAPRSQIEVSWDARPSDPANNVVKVVLLGFAAIVIAVVINDLYRTSRDPPPPPPEGTPASKAH